VSEQPVQNACTNHPSLLRSGSHTQKRRKHSSYRDHKKNVTPSINTNNAFSHFSAGSYQNATQFRPPTVVRTDHLERFALEQPT
jgi:hypothetical protein